MLGEERAMDVGDLVHEERAGAVRRTGSSTGRACGKSSAAAWTRARTSGSQSSSHATPSSTSSSAIGCVRREARDERGEERLALGDGARHRACVVEARREREAAVERDEPVRRLEPDEPAPGGRDPDRAAGVGPERRVGEAGRERRGRAAARAAGEPPGRSGFGTVPKCGFCGRDAVGELVQVRLADVRVAGLLGEADGRRALARHVVDEDRRPVRRREAGACRTDP